VFFFMVQKSIALVHEAIRRGTKIIHHLKSEFLGVLGSGS